MSASFARGEILSFFKLLSVFLVEINWNHKRPILSGTAIKLDRERHKKSGRFLVQRCDLSSFTEFATINSQLASAVF